MSTTIDQTNATRQLYGIRPWITRTVKDGGVTFVAMVEFAGAAEVVGEAFASLDDTYGIGQARSYAEEMLNDRCAELVVFAAERDQSFPTAPDATPATTEEEAEIEVLNRFEERDLIDTLAQIEANEEQAALLELERQAGVEECRPDYLAGWCAACDGTGLVVGPDRDVYDCPTCGAPPAAEVLGEGHGESASRYAWIDIRGWGWGAEPAPVVTRDAPATLPHLWGWRSANRRGAEEGQRESGHGPLLSVVRDHDYAPPPTADCPACGGSGLNDEPCKDVAGNFYRRYRPCFVCVSATTTNAQQDTHAAELAEALANETHFAGMVLSDCTAEEAAQHERLANAWRARVDMLRMFGADSALQDLAAHVAAPGWCERELSPTGLVISEWSLRADERLPFQELPAPRRKGTALRGKPGHDGCALCAAIDAAA